MEQMPHQSFKQSLPDLMFQTTLFGNKIDNPSLNEQYRVVKRHYEDLLLHYGKERGLRIARKHIGWYSKGFPDSAAFRTHFNSITSTKQAKFAIDSFYLPLIDKKVA